MEIFKRHLNSTVLIILYYLWWSFFVYRWVTVTDAHPETPAGNGNATIFMLTLYIVAFYITGFVILILTARMNNKRDYLILLGLVILPALLLLIIL